MEELTLLELIYRDGEDLLDAVRARLRAGADPNEMTEYGETPLRVASNNGRFDVVQLLVDGGADLDQLGWTALHVAVALAGVDRVEELLRDDPDLEASDYWDRTPWLLSLVTGSVEMAALLLGAGADRGARGRCGHTPLQYAVDGDRVELLRWLLSIGEDTESVDEFGNTPLIAAATYSARECARVLLDHGADVFAANDIPDRAIQVADDRAIVEMLLDAGENINELGAEVRAELTGLAASEVPEVSLEHYARARHRRFGGANPERVDEPFWQRMIRTRESAWTARKSFGGEVGEPVWSFDRFGTSITALGGGRYIEISGEHEDSYDPDFCIYNDVFVHDGRGGCEIYIYPREVFPPTDFHSATLAGGEIWIIGNLGYPQDRRPGETPVFALDVETLAIRAVDTGGELPGWISRHRADLIDGGEILVRGGKRITDDGNYVDNDEAFALSLESLTWTRLGAA